MLVRITVAAKGSERPAVKSFGLPATVVLPLSSPGQPRWFSIKCCQIRSTGCRPLPQGSRASADPGRGNRCSVGVGITTACIIHVAPLLGPVAADAFPATRLLSTSWNPMLFISEGAVLLWQVSARGTFPERTGGQCLSSKAFSLQCLLHQGIGPRTWGIGSDGSPASMA